ncbi:Protein kinase domain-containing protein [Meloidogyne graminicola]|uniref:Protein kinase domain-containing protein n=1 Tax=Meloidogyne graminicola TaxID=189291 RepID=A0A8S9ZRT7_9BILA|nr:Protein kinase domain-containing protein [Meloidogyne graminicola]
MLRNKLIFIFFFLIAFINGTIKEIVKRALILEESAGNFKKGNQYLSERVLFTLNAFYPMSRFLVLLFTDGGNVAYRVDHSESLEYNKINVIIYITIVGDNYLGSTNCYGNLTNEFKSCYPDMSILLTRIGEVCGSEGGYNSESVGVRLVIKNINFGVASSLPSYALRDELFNCENSTDKRFRVLIALFQDYSSAQEKFMQNYVGNFTRIKSIGNGLYLTSKNNSLLFASEQTSDNLLEEFLIQINIEDGSISLKSIINQKYIKVDNKGILILGSDLIKNEEKFFIEKRENEGEYSIKSKINGLFVTVNNEGILIANKENITGKNEIFEFSSYISIKERNKLLGFPNFIDENNGVYISPILGIFALFGTFIGFTLIGLMSFLIFVMFKVKNVKGDLSLRNQIYWFFRIRKGLLDRILDCTLIDIEYLIYSGPNSRVYFGLYRYLENEVKEVVVKVPSKEAFRLDMIIEETRINAQLKHERIVEYIGYYRDAFNDMRIVNEYMSGGDLHSFISSRKNILTVGHIFNFIGQISEGMEYLSSKKIIHRDLAARNCIRYFNVDANYTCSSPVRLPLRWTAIECLGQNGEILPYSKFSEKSDVWSFGIVVWECFSRGEMPYGSEEMRDVLPRLKSDWRLPRPLQCPTTLYGLLILKCWDIFPEKRPIAEEPDIIE